LDNLYNLQYYFLYKYSIYFYLFIILIYKQWFKPLAFIQMILFIAILHHIIRFQMMPMILINLFLSLYVLMVFNTHSGIFLFNVQLNFIIQLDILDHWSGLTYLDLLMILFNSLVMLYLFIYYLAHWSSSSSLLY
jgi:hypothetical protein